MALLPIRLSPAGILTRAREPGLHYTGTIQSQNRNFKQGMIQQFNLNVERQLPGNVVLTAGYAGSRSAHILVSQVNENLNDPAPARTANLQCRLHAGLRIWDLSLRSIPSSVDSNNSIGNARYDSLK
jgi:hypothetical protein